MILNLGSLAFNANLEGGGGTPAWGTELGQGEGYKFSFEDMSEFFTGMVYSSVSDLDQVSCPLGKGGNQRDDYDFVLASLFDKIFVNGKRVKDAKFLLLVIKKLVGDHHVGRRTLKYNPRMSYRGQYLNEDCYKKMAITMGYADDASWFVHEINILNQDELHFSAYLLGETPIVYNTTEERRNAFLSRLPKEGNYNLNGMPSFAEEIEGGVVSSEDEKDFIWGCIKEFHKTEVLEDLFDSKWISRGGSQRDYFVVNGCYCANELRDPSYVKNPLPYGDKWICKHFSVNGGRADVIKFGDAVNEVYSGQYRVVVEGDDNHALYKLIKVLVGEPKQIIFFGAPGTGKSFRVDQITGTYKQDVIRTTFHPDSDYSTFVGCYKPTIQQSDAALPAQPILDYDSLVDKFKGYLNVRVPYQNITRACTLFGYDFHDSIVRMQEGNTHTIPELVADAYKSGTTYDSQVRAGMACYEEANRPEMAASEITYTFVPQAFTQAYTRAWKNQDRPIFLVIEELNRGNCAQIFGDIFQLLDRNAKHESSYSIIPDRDLQQHLAKEFKDADSMPADIQSGKRMRLPSNLYIWATMNTSDQSLFPIDSAFKRRWIWRYIPIADADKDYVIEVGENEYDWWKFIEKVNNEIEGATKSEDKKLGYFFAKADNGVISADTFVSKVVFYLWNDVFKDSYDKTIFKNGLTFHRFFKPDGDPKLEVIDQFLHDLGLMAEGEDEE